MDNNDSARAVIERMLIREVLEKYLGSLDDKDWEGIASCFTDDAVSFYNQEPQEIAGGRGVAGWLRRMVIYSATDHSLSNVRIELHGDTATAHSLVIATLHLGEEGIGRVQVRGIDYQDELVKADGQWKIRRRVHRATMQFDALSQTQVLYKGDGQ